LKLSPNVAHRACGESRRRVRRTGDLAINTFVSLAIDAHTRRPRLGAGFGGFERTGH
jgi:hypothetical protein